MKWHPIIEGLYLFNFRLHLEGNGVSPGNMITAAMQRAINLRDEPQYADTWQNDAVRYTVLAVHSGHQLGLIEREDLAFPKDSVYGMGHSA